ncbi:MAG: phospholipase D-like domain-containing protein [Candidatus Heimdallarchaeota archaeon]|nr:phospholipase D-like domain-containing protein [Candidatus Heimdallarchaeota archaeon]
MILFALIIFGMFPINTHSYELLISQNNVDLDLYSPINGSPLNIKQSMTLSPIFTPDNALDYYVEWINRATTSIDIQNQYIKKFETGPWAADTNPIVRALVDAKNRGVSIRIQVNKDTTDIDPIWTYFASLGIPVRWMGSEATSTGGSFLSATHNKLMVIDGETTIISSINFSENAFKNNREAGMIIQNLDISNYFLSFFDEDWADAELPPTSLLQQVSSPISQNSYTSNFISHTNIPRTNFTGMYNVTAFVNPDNAEDTIFKYLNSATESIYVSMYTISKPLFNNTLIALKNANPSLDIQVLISYDRVGGGEDEDTLSAAQSLVDNLIPVYNSTTDNDKVDGFYHNKYWIIDGKHTFVYSGNWSPRSVADNSSSFTSGEANRDMGIGVLDAPDIASFFKNEVWQKDVDVGAAWELPVGIQLTNLKNADIISGSINVEGVVFGITATQASISTNQATSQIFNIDSTGAFSVLFDTTSLENGIVEITTSVTANSLTFTDSVEVNVVNTPIAGDWRVLITEILPNPDIVSDNEGEFIEITNSFPFNILIEEWSIGDDTNSLVFPTGTIIEAYSDIIVARSLSGFLSAYGETADYELSMSLKNTDDFVFLKNSRDLYIDVIAYGMIAPDGSETNDPAEAGISIQRAVLHVDTDSTNDFVYLSPDPRGEIPHVPIDDDNSQQSSSSDSSSEEVVSNNLLIALILIPLIKLRNKRK